MTSLYDLVPVAYVTSFLFTFPCNCNPTTAFSRYSEHGTDTLNCSSSCRRAVLARVFMVYSFTSFKFLPKRSLSMKHFDHPVSGANNIPLPHQHYTLSHCLFPTDILPSDRLHSLNFLYCPLFTEFSLKYKIHRGRDFCLSLTDIVLFLEQCFGHSRHLMII